MTPLPVDGRVAGSDVCLWAVAFGFEGVVEVVHNSLSTFGGGLDTDPIHTRAAVVGGYPLPRCHKHVTPIDPVIQCVNRYFGSCFALM